MSRFPTLIVFHRVCVNSFAFRHISVSLLLVKSRLFPRKAISSSLESSSRGEALRARSFFFFLKSVEFIISYVTSDAMSCSSSSLVRSLASKMTGTLGSQFRGSERRILSTNSMLGMNLPSNFKPLTMSVNLVNIQNRFVITFILRHKKINFGLFNLVLDSLTSLALCE